MNSSQKRIVQLLGQECFSSNSTPRDLGHLSSVEVLDMLKEAQQQAVYLLVYAQLREKLPLMIDCKDFSKCEQYYYSYCAANARNKYAHYELHKLLSSHNIRYVIIKGQVSASYYNNPSLRTSGDVDFLVDYSDRERVNDLLVQGGFLRCDKDGSHGFHWKYSKNKTDLELHWNIPGVPESNESLERYQVSILDDSIVIGEKDEMFSAPSEFHHGLILLLHALSHLTSTGMGLRHLLDWLVFVNRVNEERFLFLFEKPLKEIGLWKYAQVMTQIGILSFGCKPREWCCDIDKHLCFEILEDIISGGNFGIKDDGSRKIQTKLIRNTKSRKIRDRSIALNLVSNVNTKAKKSFPLSKKCPLFLPVGWGIVGFQYTKWKKSSYGSRINKAILLNASKRQQLYSKLNLFERERDD